MEGDKHIRAKAIIEVAGRPKEHVEKSIRAYVDKIKADSDFMILKEEYADVAEQENFWSTFVELEIVVKDIGELIGFCFDYMPSSVDIIKPESIAFTNRELNAIVNDLQAKLHNVDMVAKNRAAEAEFLKRNLRMMIQNTIALLLAHKECSLEDLSEVLKIEPKELVPILDELEKNNKVKKEGSLYRLHVRQEEG